MKFKNNLIVLLPVMAAAVAAVMAVSCQEDEKWKPTWALPLVKEQTILIDDFISDSTVQEVNGQVKKQWNNYVVGRFGATDSTNVDSIAFLVLVNNKDSTYVTFNEDGIPQLNDSIRVKIEDTFKENPGYANTKIGQINGFLENYWNAHPELWNSNPPAERTAKSRAFPKNTGNSTNNSYYKGDSAIHNLLDAMIHPTDVFITAANVLSAMGSDSKNYIDSINNQINRVLSKANMVDSIAIDFKEYVGQESPIEFIKLDVDIKSDNLPFEFKFKADFIGDKGDSICNIFDKDIGLDATLSQLPPFTSDDRKTKEIVNNTKSIKFTVKIRRTESMNEEILRTLSKKGISFSVRVQVKTAMSKLTF